MASRSQKGNIRKPCTQINKRGQDRRERARRHTKGHQFGRVKNQDAKKHSLLPVFAMPCRKSTEVTCPLPAPSFGRIASMQDLYIGRARTADRTSSRANLATAAAPPPSGSANGATASCLKQANGSTLESGWLNGRMWFLSKRQIQRPRTDRRPNRTSIGMRDLEMTRYQKCTGLTEVGVPSRAGRSLEVSESSCSFRVFSRF